MATDAVARAAPDVFLSYSSADLRAAEALEAWFETPPRSRFIWRDRRGIAPGAPNYYEPIQAAIAASATFVLLLSASWLRSEVAVREFGDAQTRNKKIIPVVHPDIPRDPETAEGRARKAELMAALDAHRLREVLEPYNWVWIRLGEGSPPDFMPVESALATDFDWAKQYAVLALRFERWSAARDPARLLRGSELVELTAAALAGEPSRLPRLSEAQREYLSASQTHEEAERSRVEGLYWQARARSLAFAARERANAEPDLALLLAAQSVEVAPVPEARAILFDLVDRYASLTAVLRGHEPLRWVSGLAFAPDRPWLASIDRPAGLGDDRPSRWLIHDAMTGRTLKSVQSQVALTAVAWGVRWAAVASRGSIGWLRYDEWKKRFRGNTPTPLAGEVSPDYLAFSPAGSPLEQEWLAWGTQWGDLGLIRVGDHARTQILISDERSSETLRGVAWLQDGRLLTAERGRLLARSVPGLEITDEIARLGRIHALATDGADWVVSFTADDRGGLLFGRGVQAGEFQRLEQEAAGGNALALAMPWALTSSQLRRSGQPAVELRSGAERFVLLHGEDQSIGALASSQGGRFAAAGERRGAVWLWDRDRRSHLVVDVGLGEPVAALAVRHDGSVAAAAHGRPALLNFGAAGTGPVLSETALPFALERLLVADDELLGVSSTHGVVRIGQDRASTVVLPPGSGSTLVAAARAARVVAIRSASNAIALYRLVPEGFAPLQTLDIDGHVVAFTLDAGGHHLYVLTANMFGIISRHSLHAPHEGPTQIARISVPIGPAAMATGQEDGAVMFADDDDLVLVGAEGEQVRPGGHDEPIKRIVVAPRLLASIACSYRERAEVDAVRLWTSTGSPAGSLALPEYHADAAFTADGSALLVIGTSGALYRVELNPQQVAASARRIASRELTSEERRRYGLSASMASVAGSGGANAAP